MNVYDHHSFLVFLSSNNKSWNGDLKLTSAMPLQGLNPHSGLNFSGLLAAA